jgi:hypothetical protein
MNEHDAFSYRIVVFANPNQSPGVPVEYCPSTSTMGFAVKYAADSLRLITQGFPSVIIWY